METRPKEKVKRFLPPSALIYDSNGNMVAIPPKYTFSSTLEVEFYIEGAALFEKDAMEENGNPYINNPWDYHAIDVFAMVSGTPPRK